MKLCKTLANDSKAKLRQLTDDLLQSKLKPWLEDKKSESWMMSEMSISLWMTFRSELSLETEPLKRDGRETKIQMVSSMNEVQKVVFERLDTNLERLDRDKWVAPQRRLAHRTPPNVQPHVARRIDLKVSDEQSEAMQLLTDKPWTINQSNWDDVKRFRESLSEEDRNKIFYDYEDEVIESLVAEEDQVDSDKLADLFDRIEENLFHLVVSRMDESGRMYPKALHPVYSRFLRCVMQGRSEKLTDAGWLNLRRHITESFGTRRWTDAMRDAWANKVDRDAKSKEQLMFHAKGKKFADELAAARGWLEARETGSTSYTVYRDFVAQGMGLIAARQNFSEHHQMVNVASPHFLSAHDRFSQGLTDSIRNLRIHSLDDLKPISKSCITPGQYGGGESAISCKLTDMSKDAFGEWNFGEDGLRIPSIDPILLEHIGKDLSPDEQMDAIGKLSKKLTRVLHRKFPFLRSFQDEIRKNWKYHLSNGDLPIYRGTDGYEYQTSPFKVHKGLTRAVRYRRRDENFKVIGQPSCSTYVHTLEDSGTPLLAKRIFMLDRLIAVRIIRKLGALGIFVTSIHDAFGVHPNHMHILERVATEAYNEVMSENAETLGRAYHALPADAVLLRA